MPTIVLSELRIIHVVVIETMDFSHSPLRGSVRNVSERTENGSLVPAFGRVPGMTKEKV